MRSAHRQRPRRHLPRQMLCVVTRASEDRRLECGAALHPRRRVCPRCVGQHGYGLGAAQRRLIAGRPRPRAATKPRRDRRKARPWSALPLQGFASAAARCSAATRDSSDDEGLAGARTGLRNRDGWNTLDVVEDVLLNSSNVDRAKRTQSIDITVYSGIASVETPPQVAQEYDIRPPLRFCNGAE